MARTADSSDGNYLSSHRSGAVTIPVLKESTRWNDVIPVKLNLNGASLKQLAWTMPPVHLSFLALVEASGADALRKNGLFDREPLPN